MSMDSSQLPDTCGAIARGHGGSAAGGRQEMAVLTLDEQGMIHDCNRDSEALFKYPRNELVRRHVSMLLPQLAEWELMQGGQPNPRLRFLCRSGHHYQAVTKNGWHFPSNLFFNRLDGAGQGGMSLIVRPVAPPGDVPAHTAGAENA